MVQRSVYRYERSGYAIISESLSFFFPKTRTQEVQDGRWCDVAWRYYMVRSDWPQVAPPNDATNQSSSNAEVSTTLDNSDESRALTWFTIVPCLDVPHTTPQCSTVQCRTAQAIAIRCGTIQRYRTYSTAVSPIPRSRPNFMATTLRHLSHKCGKTRQALHRKSSAARCTLLLCGKSRIVHTAFSPRRGNNRSMWTDYRPLRNSSVELSFQQVFF